MPAERPPYLQFDRASRRLRLDPHEPAFVQDPYAAYAFLHEVSPSFFWEDYGMWCLAFFDGVDRALRDKRLGRARPGGYLAHVRASGERAHLAHFDAVEAASLLELEPPGHTRLRKMVNRAFVSRRIEHLRPRIEALCDGLVDAMPRDRPFDLVAAYATPIPIAIITDMLGVPTEDGPRLLEWSHRMVAMYMHAPDTQAEHAADAAARDFEAYIRSQAEEKRRNPGDDLLSLLAQPDAQGERLPEEEIVSTAILLLNAGHEATVHQIGNAVALLLAQGGDPRRHLASPEMTAATVEECLRCDPPLHMFTRHVYEAVEPVPGIVLEPGAEIGLLLGAANRDPRAFAAPSAFRPGRSDGRHVSFGAGIHFCLGAPLARLELQVGLQTLCRRLPGLRLHGQPHFRDSYHFHGLERLDCVLS